MSIREHFVKQFGEPDAAAIEAAAQEHADDINSKDKGSDLFRWAITICIGYECMSKDSYRDYHCITAPWNDLRQWIIDHGDISNHDGDSDYLAALCGAYNEFTGQEPFVKGKP